MGLVCAQCICAASLGKGIFVKKRMSIPSSLLNYWLRARLLLVRG